MNKNLKKYQDDIAFSFSYNDITAEERDEFLALAEEKYGKEAVAKSAINNPKKGKEQMQSIGELVDFVLKNPTTTETKFVDYEVVDSAGAEKIEQATGINVKGFTHRLDTNAVKHIFKEHGNAKIEEERAQIAITKEDFEKIPDVLKNPNFIVNGKRTNENKLLTIAYVKRVNGFIVVVEQVLESKEKRTKYLPLLSMRKHKVKPNKTPDELMQEILTSLKTSETPPSNTKVNKEIENTKEVEKNTTKTPKETENLSEILKKINSVLKLSKTDAALLKVKKSLTNLIKLENANN